MSIVNLIEDLINNTAESNDLSGILRKHNASFLQDAFSENNSALIRDQIIPNKRWANADEIIMQQ